MKKLKILVLSDYAFVKGGAERVAINSSIELAKKGHEVVFFSAVGPVSKDLEKSSLKKIICLNQDDILDSKNKIQAGFNGIINFNANRKLKSLLQDWHPDIAHVHGLSKALSWSPINVLYSCRVPVVYTLHDYGLLCPNLGIYDYKKNENCQFYQKGYGIKCLLTNCDKRNYFQKLWRWSRYFLTKYVFRISKKINGFIAVSNFISGTFKNNYYFKKEKLRVIYNPIDVPEKNGIKSSKKPGIKDIAKFLFVGRLSREKGIDMLVDLMGDLNAELTIIGSGELMKYCMDKSNEIGSGKIKILGYQDKAKIFKEMIESNALILPSRWMEPAPLVIGEAAYNGLPSIVSDTGGLKELVEDGITGFYFKSGDLESLKNKMVNIIENPGLAMKAGIKAKEKISCSDFNIDTHINKLEKFYGYILDQDNPSQE